MRSAETPVKTANLGNRRKGIRGICIVQGGVNGTFFVPHVFYFFFYRDTSVLCGGKRRDSYTSSGN